MKVKQRKDTLSSFTKSQQTNLLYLKKFCDSVCKMGIIGGWSVSDDIVMNYLDNFGHTNVTLVGSNPSGKSPDCSAFHPDTKSRQFVDRWFEGKNICVTYMNLVDYKTEGNKQLKTSEIKAEIDNIKTKFKKMDKIVACGKIAVKGLTMAGIPHFEMPHPSGLCRFWNDEEAGKQKVEEMLRWVIE